MVLGVRGARWSHEVVGSSWSRGECGVMGWCGSATIEIPKLTSRSRTWPVGAKSVSIIGPLAQVHVPQLYGCMLPVTRVWVWI